MMQIAFGHFWCILIFQFLSPLHSLKTQIYSLSENVHKYRSSIVVYDRGNAFDNNPDFISRVFGRFLPKPEEIGLTRYDRNSRPENFPCVKDRFASLLPEDSKEKDMPLMRLLLANTNLEYRPLQLSYDANRDGWNANIFHDKVDKRGPAIVLCRLLTGSSGSSEKEEENVFGGYNPTGWVNYGEYRGSIAAFLYTITNSDTTNSNTADGKNTKGSSSSSNNRDIEKLKKNIIKLAKISGAGLAQIDDGSGPKFGMEGLTIELHRSSPRKVRSKLGLYYECLPSGGKSLLPGGKGALLLEGELSELKVYTGVYAQGEKIPYSDALPFALN